MHWDESTISTSDVPMPKATAPIAPWVEVCESPHTMVMPGNDRPVSGPTTMDNAVLLGVHLELRHAKLFTVAVERLYLLAAHGILHGLILVVSLDVMVGHAVDLVGAEHLESALTKPVESLWRRDLMAVQPVNVKLGGTVFHNLHDVAVPNLVK